MICTAASPTSTRAPRRFQPAPRHSSGWPGRLACESPGVPQRRRASRSGLGCRNSTAPVGCQFSPACSLGRRDDVFRRRSLPGMKPAVRGPIVAAAWAVCGRRPGRDRPRAGRPRRRLRVTSTSGRSRQGSRRSSSSPPTRTAMRSTRGRSSCCASAFATAGPRTGEPQGPIISERGAHGEREYDIYSRRLNDHGGHRGAAAWHRRKD